MSKRKSPSLKLYPKLSTVTIATSTPKRNHDTLCTDVSHCSAPSNVSTIHERSGLSNELTSTENLSSSESSEEEMETEPKTKKHVANVGKDWSTFRPHDRTSFYFVVVTETDLIKDLAYRWLDLWEEHPTNGTIFMLQFFVDVAGYQNYHISKIYGTAKFNEKTLIEEFKNSCPKSLEDYTYLLRTHSGWSKRAKEAIFEFIEEIVTLSDRRSKHNYSMLTELFRFLKIMSHSQIRALKHTSVVFAAKSLVPLSKLNAKHSKQIQKYYKDKSNLSEFQSTKFDQEKCNVLLKFMKYLLRIISENYFIQDVQLEDMRKECLISMYKLLHYDSDFFFKMKCLEILVKFLIDQNSKIRLTAVETFKKIVKHKKNYTYFSKKASNTFLTLSRSLYDIDYNIAITTVEVFCDSLKLYSKQIPNSVMSAIFQMVYNKYYPLGNAAGQFLYGFLRNQQKDSIEIIKSIVKFSKMPKVEKLIPVLVESLIDCTPELQAYQIMIDLLLTDELSRQNKKHLIQILSHSVMQIVTGEATLLRIKHRKEVVEKNKAEEVLEKILPRIDLLFDKYSEEVICVKSILQMLLIFSYQDNVTICHRATIMKTLNILSHYFLNNNDPEILDLISKIFSIMCDNYCPLKTCGTTILENIFHQCKEKFKTISDTENSWDENSIVTFEKVLLQLQMLFKYHNLSMEWNFTYVQNIFSEITTLNEKVLAYNLECSYYYTKNVFRKVLLENLPVDLNEETIKNVEQLKKRNDEFLEFCFEHVRNEKSKVVAEKAFECFCNFLVEVTNEVYARREKQKSITNIQVIATEEHKFVLVKFVNEHVFDFTVPESIGLKLLTAFVDVIMKRGLPISLLPEIFINYNKFYQIYGSIFDQILKNLSPMDPHIISTVVMTSLIVEFRKLKNREISVTSRQYIEIKKLGLQFIKRLTTRLLVASLRIGVNFSFTKAENIFFLMYLDDFCYSIPFSTRKYMSEYMVKLENYKRFEKNKYIIEFRRCLNSKKRPREESARAVAPRPSSSTSTSNVNVSYQSTEEQPSEIMEEDDI